MSLLNNRHFSCTDLAADAALCYTMDILRKGGNSYFINS
ncbi:hypothetical protein HMPREF1141_1570 [Clostridium sp. MSTE9]|nr:hypothetical protein HMPREF1141_1570 [Clostridium sp. MSTE9]